MDLKVGGKVFRSRGTLLDKFNWPRVVRVKHECSPGCSPEINARGRCDVFILKRSALRAAATRWCGRELPRRSGGLSSQGLPVPTLLLYLSPLLLQAAFERKAFYLFSRVRGLPLQCLTTTTLILHFKWGANVSPECFSEREVGLDAACYAGCLFSFPFT